MCWRTWLYIVMYCSKAMLRMASPAHHWRNRKLHFDARPPRGSKHRDVKLPHLPRLRWSRLDTAVSTEVKVKQGMQNQ